jgi:Flp pilus assembly protein TadD
MPKAIRFAPTLAALLLGCGTLTSAAQAGWFSSDPKPAETTQKDDKAQAAPQPATTMDDSIRQAQMLRLAGNYKEALNHLSQLMLVAADDSRVITEYGKTLVSMGRADEAEKFLTRAQQLQPNDWTVYSALGVAYDEQDNQKDAQINYERALALKPGEPSVLSNYALSRMLAKDPITAGKLADRAEIANAAAKDDKIARNIAMIRSAAPQVDNFAVNSPAPSPVPNTAAALPMAAPHVAVATVPLAPAQHFQPMTIAQPAPAVMAPSAPPRVLAANSVIQAEPQMPQLLNQQPRGVVMQAVPVDPLAGPVASKTGAATRAPRALQPEAQANTETSMKAARADAPKPAGAQVSPAESLEARAEAIAKTLNKPGAIAQAKADANRGLPAKPAALTTAAAASKVSLPVKAADVKPSSAQASPKVLAPAPVKSADAKPQGKTAAKPPSKDAIPGLRLSANAY